MHSHSLSERAQRFDRLEKSFRALSKSPTRKKKASRPDPLKPYEMASRCVKAQQKAALALRKEKGGFFVDGKSSRRQLTVGKESTQSIEEMMDMFAWSAPSPKEGSKATSKREPSIEDMLEMFIWSNEFTKEEKEVKSVSVEDDHESPLKKEGSSIGKKEKKHRGRREKKQGEMLQGSAESCAETVVVSNVARKVEGKCGQESVSSCDETVLISNTKGKLEGKCGHESVSSYDKTVAISNSKGKAIGTAGPTGSLARHLEGLSRTRQKAKGVAKPSTSSPAA